MLRRFLLTSSGPFLLVFWKLTNNLHLPLGDAVLGWLVVSSFSCLDLQFFLAPVNNSESVSKYWLLPMIQLFEFYSLHLILCPKLITTSSSIPFSTFLSHSYAVYRGSFQCLNMYVLLLVPVFNVLLKCACYIYFALDPTFF